MGQVTRVSRISKHEIANVMNAWRQGTTSVEERHRAFRSAEANSSYLRRRIDKRRGQVNSEPPAPIRYYMLSAKPAQLRPDIQCRRSARQRMAIAIDKCSY